MYAVIDRENKEVFDVFVSKDSEDAKAFFDENFTPEEYFSLDVIKLADLLPEKERLSVWLDKKDFSEKEIKEFGIG